MDTKWMVNTNCVVYQAECLKFPAYQFDRNRVLAYQDF
jgi:hypothetical protein